MIIGEIRRFLRDDGMIKVSRTVKETAVRARQLQAKYEAAYGIEPTVCQLASLMQIAPEELASALSSSQEVESLQKTIYKVMVMQFYLRIALSQRKMNRKNL